MSGIDLDRQGHSGGYTVVGNLGFKASVPVALLDVASLPFRSSVRGMSRKPAAKNAKTAIYLDVSNFQLN